MSSPFFFRFFSVFDWRFLTGVVTSGAASTARVRAAVESVQRVIFNRRVPSQLTASLSLDRCRLSALHQLAALGQKQTHALQQAGLFNHLVGSQQYGGGHRSNVEGSASGATTRCSWDNSARPGAGEKLSLLPAK
jgi:hypothetical protein